MMFYKISNEQEIQESIKKIAELKIKEWKELIEDCNHNLINRQLIKQDSKMDVYKSQCTECLCDYYDYLWVAGYHGTDAKISSEFRDDVIRFKMENKKNE